MAAAARGRWRSGAAQGPLPDRSLRLRRAPAPPRTGDDSRSDGMRRSAFALRMASCGDVCRSQERGISVRCGLASRPPPGPTVRGWGCGSVQQQQQQQQSVQTFTGRGGSGPASWQQGQVDCCRERRAAPKVRVASAQAAWDGGGHMHS